MKTLCDECRKKHFCVIRKKDRNVVFCKYFKKIKGGKIWKK